MNELVITLDGGQWLYFKTLQMTADKALEEFEETCNNNEIDVSNINISSVELRNFDTLETIDTLTK